MLRTSLLGRRGAAIPYPHALNNRANNPRALLRAMLRDGNTAANFEPGVGVTGTLNCSSWADQSGNGRDLAQASGAAQPAVLSFSGQRYAWLPGVAGNYFSAASATTEFTTAMAGWGYLAQNDWTHANDYAVIAKRTAGKEAFQFLVAATTGLPYLSRWTSGGVNSIAGDAAVPFSDVSAWYLGFTQNGTTVKFWYSSDGATWTQLGSTVSIVNGALPLLNTDAPYEVGSILGGTAFLGSGGKVYRAKLFATDSFAGAAVRDFDAAKFTETSANGATATMATGEVFTLNCTGAKPAMIVASPSLLFDGSASFMSATVPISQPKTTYLVLNQVSWTASRYVIDGSDADYGAIFQSTSSPKVNISQNIGGTVFDGPAVGSYGILTAVFNGANSLGQTNANAPVASALLDWGVSDIKLGCRGTSLLFSNIQVKELIVRNAADSAATRLAIQQRLAQIHGIAL